MNLSVWDTSHSNSWSAREKDPIALLLPGDGALQDALCPIPGSWASVPRGGLKKYVLRQSCITESTHKRVCALLSIPWISLNGSCLGLEMPALWYHHLWWHELHCSKWHGRFPVCWGRQGQDLISDNPACTSEPRDSWVSVPLMTKADGSQSLYQKGENEGQTTIGFSHFKNGHAALHAWQDRRFSSVPPAVSSFLRFCWLCFPVYMIQADGRFSAQL